jgi:hypothetical protein
VSGRTKSTDGGCPGCKRQPVVAPQHYPCDLCHTLGQRFVWYPQRKGLRLKQHSPLYDLIIRHRRRWQNTPIMLWVCVRHEGRGQIVR